MNADELARRKRRHRKERIVAAAVVLVILGATVAIWLWSEQTARELRRDQTYIPKKPVITPASQLLQEYVRIDTSTPAGQVQGARWLATILRREGIEPELIASAPDRLNVYARLRGRKSGDGLLLFNHIDVVPADGSRWRVPPFAGNVVADSLHGRGTIDMKGVAITQLLAFLSVARSGKPPAHDLVFLATADEEVGSELGMRWLLAHRPDVFAGIRYGLTEGGLTELIGERMTYFGIETGGKQVVQLTLWSPDRERLQRFRIALEPHLYGRSPGRVLPIVREYFRSASPTRFASAPYLRDIDWAIREGHFWRLPMPYRDLTQNTIWASDALARNNRWELDLHLRNLPDEDPEARIAWLQRVMQPYGVQVAKVHAKEGPAPVSSTATPLFALLKEEAGRRYQTPAGPYLGYRSSSDSRLLRPKGIICYGVSPFPVDFAGSRSIHGENERIRLDYFADGVDYMKNVVTQWSERD
jgi:acetylornithine deacetylase/succinyl-diaminopimelate desuccinylase-like protein